MSKINTPHIIVFKRRLYFSLSKFLITCLCNSSANCWFDIISLLMAELPHAARVSHLSLVSRKYFIKNFINHRTKSMLKSIIFCNLSNIKCFFSFICLCNHVIVFYSLFLFYASSNMIKLFYK